VHVLTVIGNRPQFIKLAAVSPLLREQHRETLVHTGQHHDRELSDVFFEELELPEPDHELGISGGSNSHQVGRMLVALDDLLRNLLPDLVLVYGDTNSTLAGALAGAHAGVPVAHVEAGLRSFDRSMPEEVNRVVCDALAGLLLAPSQTAVDNLAAEGVIGRVELTGDVMGDIALRMAVVAQEQSRVLGRFELEPREYLLVTAHRAANVDRPERLAMLVDLLASLPLRVVFPVHPRTRARLEEFGLLSRLEGLDQMSLCEPLGYLDTLSLAGNARAVITDSGGLQKEAAWLGTPCVTLRDRTEWVETVEQGLNTTIDLDTGAALAALDQPHTPSDEPLYGAGNAGRATVAAISSYLASQG
jgi:UDP-N-acetylglucosamine 2-epimerase (non-hydrolysing)/UDP-GlcNAc3NAcA epimerase